MQGYLITFFTEQGRRQGHQPLHEWLIQAAKTSGISGSTAVCGSEGTGRSGRRHSVHFFELADRPIEVQVAATAAQADALFSLIARERVEVFYVKAEVEFGTTARDI